MPIVSLLLAAAAHVLLDAPCTGTGTLARNPEIRWRLQPDDLATAHTQQIAMLRNALQILAPGGRLIYSTCSLEPEENEQVIAGVPGLEVQRASVPPRDQMDGAFVARFRRVRG